MKKSDLDILTEEEAEEYLDMQGKRIRFGEENLIDSTTVIEEMVKQGYQSILLNKSETYLFVYEPEI